jgi:hypothetical protein
MVAHFVLGRRHVADGFEQPAMIEPIHPVERGELDGLEMAPRAFSSNHLGLKQPDDRFGERVVVGIAAAADRRGDPGLGEAIGVAHRQVLGGFNRSLQHLDREELQWVPRDVGGRIVQDAWRCVHQDGRR